ncbi:MAG TPA: molybdopterin-dependent oxidoreductase [Acidimicrobiia bacterium]|nr:molybdopterin-dependent oxidoreductase [Acidimicrobiia bacterium]
MNDPERGTPVGRRVFLGLVALGAAGVVAGAKVQNWLAQALAPLEAKDPTGLTSLLPFGNYRFYSITGSFPHRSRDAYTLQVTGLVEKPFTISYAQLTAMPSVELRRDFQCVTGWRVPDQHWTGVQLSKLLDRAGVKAHANALRFVSFDGAYTESLTLAQARRSDVIVAYELEGAPLSTDHGGPARLYVAPMYGYKSCKWLQRIEVTAQVEPGYWEQNGYDVDGWVGHSNGRNDTPT